MSDEAPRVLDLFSGIGGFSLGLERAGMRTVAFCEIDPYCRAVLAKHWPNVPCYDDVRTLTAERLAADGIVPDVICGGFPCQDISLANNRGAGISGSKSGLWRELARLIRDVRPRFALLENVPILRSRGLGVVLGDLAACGYNAEWQCLPACSVGAPHIRDRIWILAYPNGDREPDGAEHAEASGHPPSMDNASRRRHRPPQGPILTRWQPSEFSGWWASEPGLDRVAYGLPAQVDRLRCLGNSIIPQIPEAIGRAIMTTWPRPRGHAADGTSSMTGRDQHYMRNCGADMERDYPEIDAAIAKAERARPA